MAPPTRTLGDLESVLAILAAFRLPNELALSILDYAHYWVETEDNSTEHFILVDEAWSRDYSAAYPYFYVPVYRWHQAKYQHLKIREIAFTIVSHDQGWTTEHTQGTYETSSWFEVSILRPKEVHSSQRHHEQRTFRWLRDMTARREIADSVTSACNVMHPDGRVDLVRRPSSIMEPQRLHCTEMREVKSQGVKEGEYAWYLQGNEVAMEKSVFEGDMVKRYNVTWGCKANPIQVANEGAGSGEDFIDSLERDDLICVWARAKVDPRAASRLSTL